MTRTFSVITFALGAVVVLWMGASFVHSNALALLVTVLIAVAYTAGFIELWRYQSATGSLEMALAGAVQPVEDLKEWLQKLSPSLRFAVRQRIFGESTGLPAPLLTPYLVGLLVMLGLLGTFIGMVETLQGAVSALEGTTELEAVRKGLAAPIQGLGMAFATSVAGVTASAMLGLISTLSRKQRLQASRQLDAEMAGAFKHHSLSYQRRQTYQAMQSQSLALPVVADQLTTLAKNLDERMQSLIDNLSGTQQRLQEDLAGQYQQLSSSVEAALTDGFKDTGRLAAESAEPIFKKFADTLAEDSKSSRELLDAAAEQQVRAFHDQLKENNAMLNEQWQGTLDNQQRANELLLNKISDQVAVAQSQFSGGANAMLGGLQQANEQWLEQWQKIEGKRFDQWQSRFEQSAESLAAATEELAERTRQAAADNQNDILKLMAQSEALMAAMQEREADARRDAAEQFDNLIAATNTHLEALRADEQLRGEAAIARLGELQEASAKQLASLGEALETPMSRLIETASDAPRAAAEVIEQLRGEISKNIERDNSLLEERQQTLSKLNELSASLEENARLQREAVQSLLEGSGEQLSAVAQEFAEKIAAESGLLGEQMSHFSASAAELSALGEVFTKAVEQFGEVNTQLMARLEHIESVLVTAGERSDQQMEYYLGQAREIIDHNLLTHQELLDRVAEANGKQV